MCIPFRKKGTKAGEDVYAPRQIDSDASSFRKRKYKPPAHIQRETERMDRQYAMRQQQAAFAATGVWRKNGKRSGRYSGGGGGGDSYGGPSYYAVMPGGHSSGFGGYDSGGGGCYDSGGGGGCDSGGGGGGDGGGGGGGGGGD